MTSGDVVRTSSASPAAAGATGAPGERGAAGADQGSAEPARRGGLTARLDRLQRRHPAAGFPLAVVYKYVDDGGGYLAALIAYYGFLSLFPLLLLLSTVLSIILAGNPALQQQVLSSALNEFPVVGHQLGPPRSLSGGPVGLAVGVLGSVYGGLGVAQAMQYAMNTAWSVPKNERPDPLRSRLRGMVLLGTAGLGVVGTTALSAMGGGSAGAASTLTRIAALLAALVINGLVFVLAFRVATARHLTWRQVAPGAFAAAVLWQLMQAFGVVYVGHVIKGASASNGVFALVLGLLAFFYVTAVAVVLCAEINVVRVQRLYPRSLLTPFTDDVVLTRGDRKTYTSQATAQRNKGFQDIDVTFRPREGDRRSDDLEG
jgi:YihY family inner membrane protein